MRGGTPSVSLSVCVSARSSVLTNETIIKPTLCLCFISRLLDVNANGVASGVANGAANEAVIMSLTDDPTKNRKPKSLPLLLCYPPANISHSFPQIR